MMVNNIGLRNRVVQSSSSSLGASAGSEKTAVEGNQGTVVAMSTGKVQTRKNARGFVLAKASESEDRGSGYARRELEHGSTERNRFRWALCCLLIITDSSASLI